MNVEKYTMEIKILSVMLGYGLPVVNIFDDYDEDVTYKICQVHVEDNRVAPRFIFVMNSDNKLINAYIERTYDDWLYCSNLMCDNEEELIDKIKESYMIL